MPKDEVKRLQVTFAKSLPMGTRGTFAHEGELWIAYPASKNRRINAALDRLIGNHNRIRKEMIRWINTRPQDAELVVHALEIAKGVDEFVNEIMVEKAEAITM